MIKYYTIAADIKLKVGTCLHASWYDYVNQTLCSVVSVKFQATIYQLYLSQPV
jgi:hypothetical protein